MSATTETVSSSLPPYLAAAYRQAAERGLTLSREPYQHYAHRTLANRPESINRSLNMANETGVYAPYLRDAEALARRGTEHFTRGHHAYKDPYQERLVNNLATEGQRTFKEKVMPELNARFIRLGQYGSTKHAKMARNAARDIQRETLAQQEEALSHGHQQSMQAFNLDRSRALQAAGLMNQLGVARQATQLEDIRALREAGMITQGQEQAMLDQLHEQWKEERRHPYEKLMEYFRVLQGTPGIPSTYSRREAIRPSDIYHGSDWRNLIENIGINALGSYGRDLLGQFQFAGGGSVPPPYLVGI